MAPAQPLLLRELNYRQEGINGRNGRNGLADFLSQTEPVRTNFCEKTVVPHVFEKAPGPSAEFVADLHQTGGAAWNILNRR